MAKLNLRRIVLSTLHNEDLIRDRVFTCTQSEAEEIMEELGELWGFDPIPRYEEGEIWVEHLTVTDNQVSALYFPEDTRKQILNIIHQVYVM